MQRQEHAQVGVLRALMLVVAPLLLGFAVLAWIGIETFQEVQVSGPLYQRVARKKDLLADILPPPAYLIETHLLCHELLHTPPHARSALAEVGDELERLYHERLAYWTDHLTVESLRQELLGPAASHARSYFAMRRNQFLPALERQDLATAKALLCGPMGATYAAHRSSIDLLVAHARMHANIAERTAAANTQTAMERLLATLGGTLLVAIALNGLVLLRVDRTQSAMRLAARRLEEAQALGRLGNWTFDPMAQQATCSRQVHQLLAIEPEERPVPWQVFLERLSPDDRTAVAQAVANCLASGEPFTHVASTVAAAPGIRHVRLEGRRSTHSRQQMFGTLADVTTEVERERDLQTLRVRAEAASQAKSEFLANMSHELRTPMTAILGYTDMLLEDGEGRALPEAQRDCVTVIRRHGTHLLSLLNDILDLSRIEAGRMTVEQLPVEPLAVLQEVLALMALKAESKGLQFTATCATPVPQRIHSDPVRLRQILVNLVGNAIKFTATGSVEIRVGITGPSPDELCFAVRDTGIGIAPDHLATLFQAFAQGDSSMARRFGGSGLGLHISRRLAGMLGGSLTATSEPGRGSEFVLAIGIDPASREQVVPAGPVAAAATALEAAPTRAEAPARPLQGVKILLAEDGPDNARLITALLRKAGAEVAAVGNGRLAVEALTTDGSLSGPLQQPAAYDLLLTDMQMPELDGYAATRLLREKGCRLPIVALTAHAMAGDMERCLAAGCDAYTTKPIERQRLLALCRRLVGAAPPPV